MRRFLPVEVGFPSSNRAVDPPAFTNDPIDFNDALRFVNPNNRP
jgi:hypothetical protein